MLCLWLSLGIGGASGVLTGALIPSLGHLALPLVVFLVALLIVRARTQRLTSNMLSWFLGMAQGPGKIECVVLCEAEI